MVNRDAKTKQALIEYLQKDTDERFWQAIANFAEARGLCKHYLITTDDIPETDKIEDLFFQESDSIHKN